LLHSDLFVLTHEVVCKGFLRFMDWIQVQLIEIKFRIWNVSKVRAEIEQKTERSFLVKNWLNSAQSQRHHDLNCFDVNFFDKNLVITQQLVVRALIIWPRIQKFTDFFFWL
jgi:hypothetical protein